MEVKSRYEVVADLERQKRDLIRERDTLTEQLENKQVELVKLERQKADTIVVLDRKIEDMTNELTKFQANMNDRKEMIKELIASVDQSLERFSNMGQKK